MNDKMAVLTDWLSTLGINLNRSNRKQNNRKRNFCFR